MEGGQPMVVEVDVASRLSFMWCLGMCLMRVCRAICWKRDRVVDVYLLVVLSGNVAVRKSAERL